jgi:hypothetical protein
MQNQTSLDDSLAGSILNQVERLVLEAEKADKPLEVDPFRSQLFELFVTADAAGYTDDESEPDLSADGLCKQLAAEWKLAAAARESFEHQTKLDAESLSRMRLLWSLMRMWMEWSYAWQRWPEFRGSTGGQQQVENQ